MEYSMIKYINNSILGSSRDLKYTVRDVAPSTFQDLRNESSLVVWSGASDSTIFQDKVVNWAFRAFHDTLHLKSGLLFTVDHEIELAKIQASQFGTNDLMQALMYTEIAGQAEYFRLNGTFPENQLEFSATMLSTLLKGRV